MGEAAETMRQILVQTTNLEIISFVKVDYLSLADVVSTSHEPCPLCRKSQYRNASGRLTLYTAQGRDWSHVGIDMAEMGCAHAADSA